MANLITTSFEQFLPLSKIDVMIGLTNALCPLHILGITHSLLPMHIGGKKKVFSRQLFSLFDTELFTIKH